MNESYLWLAMSELWYTCALKKQLLHIYQSLWYTMKLGQQYPANIQPYKVNCNLTGFHHFILETVLLPKCNAALMHARTHALASIYSFEWLPFYLSAVLSSKCLHATWQLRPLINKLLTHLQVWGTSKCDVVVVFGHHHAYNKI